MKTFFFFSESTCACVLGPWPWPRAFLSLASRVSVLGKAVLDLGLGFFCVLGLGLGLEPCVLDSTSGYGTKLVVVTCGCYKLVVLVYGSTRAGQVNEKR